MASYYLDYSAAAGKYMLMPAFAISAGQDFDFSFDYKFDNSNYGRPFGWNGSSSFLNRVLIFHSAAGNTVRITTSATNIDFTVPAYTRTDWHNFRFARASGVITCYFDGASVGTAANNEAFTPNLMFAQSSSLQQSVSCSMRNVKLSIAGSPNREYLNSVGTGSTWVDIVSGQNATQQGSWPADDSEWVPYGATGIELQATIACASSLGASLTTQIPLAASINASSSLSASLTTSITLQTNIATSSSLTANLRAGTTPLSADIQSTTALTANLSGGAETTTVVPGVGFTYRYANKYGQLANRGLLTNKGRRTLKGAPVP